MLLQIIEVLIILGKHELVFRGHNERSLSFNQGNFHEMFNLLIKRNDEFLSYYEKISNVFTSQTKPFKMKLYIAFMNTQLIS